MDNQITPDFLNEIGTALYGSNWVGDLAKNLNVSTRTVRYWRSGEYPVPPKVNGDIAALLDEAQTNLSNLRARL